MGTKWSEIISNHAMLEIDDVRLQEEAASDPAAFLRRMSLYLHLFSGSQILTQLRTSSTAGMMLRC